MKAILLPLLMLSGCATTNINNSVPKMFIGEIVSLEILYGEPYRSNWAVPKKRSKNEDLIISNACGYAKASFRDINSTQYDKSRFKAGTVIGEWCRNPFSLVKHHQDQLVVPLRKNINRPWQKGTFESIIMKVYRNEFGSFADPNAVLYTGLYTYRNDDEYFNFTENLERFGLKKFLETLEKPIIIRDLEDGEVVDLDETEKLFYAVKDKQLLLVNGLRVDNFYKL